MTAAAMSTPSSSPAPKQQRSARNHHRHTKSVSAAMPQLQHHQHHAKQHHHHHDAFHVHAPPSRQHSAPNVLKSEMAAVPAKKTRRSRRQKANLPSSDPLSVDTKAATLESTEDVVLAASPPKDSAPISQTPPRQSAPPATPNKAYAGSSFKHSPSPALLPVPKFFSNSVPAGRSAGLQAMLEEDEKNDNSDSDKEEFTTSSPSQQEQGLHSNLLALFDADRKERERKRREGSDSDPTTPEPIRQPVFFKENVQAKHESRPSMGERVQSDMVFPMDMDNNSGRRSPPKQKQVDPQLWKIYQCPGLPLSPPFKRNGEDAPTRPSTGTGKAPTPTRPAFGQRHSTQLPPDSPTPAMRQKSKNLVNAASVTPPSMPAMRSTPSLTARPNAAPSPPRYSTFATPPPVFQKMSNTAMNDRNLQLKRILNIGPRMPVPSAVAI